MPSRSSGVVREALEGAEFFLRVELDSLRYEREEIPEPEKRHDRSGEGEEICGEVLAKVREALAVLDQLPEGQECQIGFRAPPRDSTVSTEEIKPNQEDLP